MKFHIRVACFLTGFLLLAVQQTAASAERQVLGNPLSIPLNASAESHLARTLESLRSKAKDQGTVRIIVGVRAAFAPEGNLGLTVAAQQRTEIAGAQSSVLDKVTSLKRANKRLKRFETVPFIAMDVDAYELESLLNLPEVTSIEESKLSAPTLAESTALIGAPTAWSSGYTGSGQVVAVLDSGVDKAHPFLSGKVISEACYSGNLCPGGVTQTTAVGSGVNCPSAYTGCDHGTHVAGIVAGKGSSFSGVAKDANIVAIQVFTGFSAAACGASTPCISAYDDDIISGLERVYALRNTYNIAAVNMSLGGRRYYSQSLCDTENSMVKAAIDNLRSANIATVIASGNAGYADSMGAPGCISSAISVGATWDTTGYPNNCDNNYLGNSAPDQPICYSNSASFLNLLAPGIFISSSIPGGGYESKGGTSMAAPHVAGAWALLKQKNSNLTISSALNALTATGRSVTDPRNGITKPRIQINAALNAISNGCSYSLSPPSISLGAGTAGGSFSITTSAGCPWSVTSNASWITSTSSGTGSGSATYSASANTTSGARTATLNIAGQALTVTQSGAATANPSNVASSSSGAVASASSNRSGNAVSLVNNNDRTGANGGYWVDATPGSFPDWVQINFNGPKAIDQVVLYSIQDNFSSPIEPTASMTFASYGVTGFSVQTWDGASWVTQATVTGNNLVKRAVTFPAVTTDKIRVLVNSTVNGSAYIAEIEALGY